MIRSRRSSSGQVCDLYGRLVSFMKSRWVRRGMARLVAMFASEPKERKENVERTNHA